MLPAALRSSRPPASLTPTPTPTPPTKMPPNQQTILPAEQCIEALVHAGGNTRLAAERLFGDDPLAIAHLTASIAQDPLAQESLNAQIRTLITLQAFDTINAAKSMLDVVMTELEPKDFVKFYSTLLTQVTILTAPSAAAPPQPDASQLAELMLQRMPPFARKAFLTLIEGTGRAAPALDPSDSDTTEDYAEATREAVNRISGGFDGPQLNQQDLGPGGAIA